MVPRFAKIKNTEVKSTPAPNTTCIYTFRGAGFCILSLLLLNQTIIFCPILLSVIYFSFVIINKTIYTAVGEARYIISTVTGNIAFQFDDIMDMCPFSKFRFYHYFQGILEAPPPPP